MDPHRIGIVAAIIGFIVTLVFIGLGVAFAACMCLRGKRRESIR